MSPSAALLLSLALPGAPPSAACPADLTLAAALERVDHLPELGGLAGAEAAYRESTDSLGPLTGSTRLVFEPGLRAWPQNQMGPEGALAVQHSFLASRAGSARQALARRERALLRARADALLLERRLETATAWADAWEQAGLHEAALGEQRLAASLVARLEEAARSGGVLSLDVVRARAWAAELQLAAIDLEGRAFDARLALSRVLACPDAGPAATKGAPSLAMVDVGAPGRMPSRVAGAEADAAAARVRRTAEEVAPTATVGARLEADGRQTFRGLGTLELSLPTFERDELGRGAATAAATFARAEEERAAVDEAHLQEALRHEVEHSGEVLTQLERDVLPALDEAAALEERALEVGETTVVEVIRARAAALEARRRTLQARGDHLRARLRFALWTRAFAGGAS